MLIALLIVSLLAVIATAAAAALWTARRAAERRCVEVENRRDELAAQVEHYRAQTVERGEQIAALRAKQDGLADQFRALAADVLAKSREELAKQNEAALEQEQKEFSHLVKPIRELLEKNAQHIQAIEKERKQDQGSIKAMLDAMTGDQKLLRSETASLVKALRRPEVRGRWGELAIDRVLELAGLTSHCHDSQVTSPDGSLRVDKVVHLPGDREVVIDVKTPMDAFLDALECVEDEPREQCLDRHARQIEDKVKDLSSKSYQQHYRAADFIVMFIPGEAFLQAAVARRPGLIESALEKRVVIATPTTLVALLKAVALGWQEQKLAENAERIRDLGVEMHKRIAVMVAHLAKLGKAVDNTVEHYNKFVGSLESQVMPQARRFKELGADSAKELPVEGQLPVVELQVREVKEVEAE